MRADLHGMHHNSNRQRALLVAEEEAGVTQNSSADRLSIGKRECLIRRFVAILIALTIREVRT